MFISLCLRRTVSIRSIATTSNTALFLLVVSDSDNHRLQVGRVGVGVGVVRGRGRGRGTSGSFYFYLSSLLFHFFFCSFATYYSFAFIQVLMPDGSFVRTIGGPGDESGQFEDPRGLCVTQSGMVGRSGSVQDSVTWSKMVWRYYT